MTKRITTTNETPTIVLKSIIVDVTRDIKRDRKIDVDIDAKKVRIDLRKMFATQFNHVHNSSWTFTQTNARAIYDHVRAKHDAKYRDTIATRAKRATKTNATPRAKRVTKTNDDIVANVDANVIDANA
jgi:hypothetical protein